MKHGNSQKSSRYFPRARFFRDSLLSRFVNFSTFRAKSRYIPKFNYGISDSRVIAKSNPFPQMCLSLQSSISGSLEASSSRIQYFKFRFSCQFIATRGSPLSAVENCVFRNAASKGRIMVTGIKKKNNNNILIKDAPFGRRTPAQNNTI